MRYNYAHSRVSKYNLSVRRSSSYILAILYLFLRPRCNLSCWAIFSTSLFITLRTHPQLIIIPQRLKAQLNPVFASLIVPLDRVLCYHLLRVVSRWLSRTRLSSRYRILDRLIPSDFTGHVKCVLYGLCQTIIIVRYESLSLSLLPSLCRLFSR